MTGTSFFAFLHLEWLRLLATPAVVYLDGPARISFLVPLLVCLLIFRLTPLPKVSSAADGVWFSGLFLLGCAISFLTAYWGNTGLHFLASGEILWPVVVWIQGPRKISPWWAYVATFWGTLLPDVLLAGQYFHWETGFWMGVGGAGLQDALFLSPMVSLLCALILAQARSWADQKGWIPAWR